MLRVVQEVLWDRPSGWLNTRWFPLAVIGFLAGVLALLPALAPGAEAWGYDYKAFRAGAEMTLSGDLASAYDPARFAEALPPSDKPMYWMYAPHGSMLLAPVGLGPWWLGGLVLFVGGVLAAYGTGRLAGGSRREGALVLLAGLPSVFALMLGQAAPLFGALLVFALWQAPRRPGLAGLALALLTAKPQYGLLVPVFLLAHGQWRVIASAGLGTAGLVLASLALFGTAPWLAMIEHAGGPGQDFFADTLYPSMPTAQQYARFWGASAEVAGAVQIAVLALGAAAVWATRRLPYPAHVALTLLAACAVMPYAWFYDWLPAMAAVVILMRTKGAPAQLLLATWLVPFASEIQGAMLDATPPALALPLTLLVNAVELAALWGLIFVLASPSLSWPTLAQAIPFRAARRFANAASVSVGTKPST